MPLLGNQCKRNEGNGNLNATITNTAYDGTKTAAECGTFHLFGRLDNKWRKM